MRGRVHSKNGCVSCKVRRKKCDEVQPACSTCVRLGLRCSYIPAFKPERNKPDTTFSVKFEPGDSSQVPQGSLGDSMRQVYRMIAPNRLTKDLGCQAFKLSICESFVVNVSEAGWNHDVTEVDNLSALTIRAPLSLTSLDELSLSRTAWLAYCYYLFGKENHLPQAIIRSRSLFSEALATLYSLKWDGRDVGTGVDIGVAVSFLVMLEMRASMNPRAWLVHHEGLCNIIIRLGPQTFADPKRLIWFESLRCGMVFSSIIQNKASELENDAWLTVPWSRLGMHGWDQRKSMEQQMLDLILSSCKRLRGLAALKFAQDFASVERIMSKFWNDYSDILESLNHWRERNSSRIVVTGWRTYPEGSRENEIFLPGVPLFATTIATISVSWYYLLLNSVNAIAAFFCALMADLSVDSGDFELDRVIHWLWIDDPEGEHNMLAHMHDPTLQEPVTSDTDTDQSTTTWLAMADRSLELAQHAAYMTSSVIAPLVDQPNGSFLPMLCLVALVPVTKTFGEGPLRSWAHEKCLAFFGPQTFNDLMESTRRVSEVSWSG